MRSALLKRCKKIEITNNPHYCELMLFNLNAISDEEVAFAKRYFNEDENSRYEMSRHSIIKNQYALSKLLIKLILASKLECELNDIDIRYLPTGKPYLANLQNAMHFNYSDSDQTGLLALSDDPVGVDIEKITNQPDIFDTMQLTMSSQEREWVMGADPFFRFFRVWTMKEAYLKCTGKGLGATSLPDLCSVLHSPMKSFNRCNADEGLCIYTDTLGDYIYSLAMKVN